MERIMELLSDMVLKPLIGEQDLADAKQAVLFEKEDTELRPEKEAALIEMSHATSFGNSAIGLARICPDESLGLITRDVILKYFQTYYIPPRIVVSGVGVDHKELVDLAKTYFKFPEATWNVEDLKIKTTIEPDASASNYVGGITKVIIL